MAVDRRRMFSFILSQKVLLRSYRYEEMRSTLTKLSPSRVLYIGTSSVNFYIYGGNYGLFLTFGACGELYLNWLRYFL